jgi:hypothetical protein
MGIDDIKWILDRWDGVVWIGLIRLRIKTSGGLSWTWLCEMMGEFLSS